MSSGQRAPAVHYLLDDYDQPSWGAGMLYEHVRLLSRNGIDARALHHRAPFRPSWRDLDVPVEYLDSPLDLHEGDLLIVPEVAAGRVPHGLPGRRIAFVQGSFLIAQGLGSYRDYADAGFECAMAVMPHVAQIVERHFGVAATVVPPFIAPHFFDRPADERRERRILLAVKDGYRAAGIPDQEIAARLLAREVERRGGWELTILQSLSHREVGSLMHRSTFLVNVFSHEAFNTTVPEAMASGCVPICYEAGGPREFLRHQENAFVFANQQVYALVEFVARAMDEIDALESKLARMRDAGLATASAYSPAATESALLRFVRAQMDHSPR